MRNPNIDLWLQLESSANEKNTAITYDYQTECPVGLSSEVSSIVLKDNYSKIF